MAKEIKIPTLGDIKIEEGANGLYATINLDGLKYTKGNISILIDKLQRLKSYGFTSFDTSHQLGYYDDVEDISLVLIKPYLEKE